MPNLSWNAIADNATLFARDWATATREQADKQLFWNDFFTVFGMPLRTVASFEEPVRRLRGTYGFIDLLWKGTLLVEHKTAGASLEAAEVQAFDYLQDLQTVGRAAESPATSCFPTFSTLRCTIWNRKINWIFRSSAPAFATLASSFR